MLKHELYNYKLFIPTLPHLINKIKQLTKNWKIQTIISDNIDINEKYYKNVFISVTCSGTASLEISKRMIPQIVLYKLNPLTYFIFSFLTKIRFANIINIMNNKMIVKEIVNKELNKSKLISAFSNIMNEKKFRDKQIFEVKKVLNQIQSSQDPFEICKKRIKEIISTTT